MRRAVAPAAMAIVGLAAAGCGGSDTPDRLPVTQVAKRVERLRGMRFEHQPSVETVTKKQLVADERRLDKQTISGLSTRQRHQLVALQQEARARQEVLVLLGELPAGIIISSPAGDLEGLYDPRGDRVYLLRDAIGTNEATRESVLAHELTHALEAQRLHAFPTEPRLTGSDDARLAARATREGTATLVQLRYENRYLHGHGPAHRLLANARRPSRPIGDRVKRLSAAVLRFVYADGEHFASALYRDAHSWAKVNRALRRPPTRTANILHPHRPPARHDPRPPGKTQPPVKSWTPVATASFGALDTRLLLERTGARTLAARVTARWQGGRWQLWRRHGAPTTSTRRGDWLLAIGWRWRSRQTARAQGELLARDLRRRQRARPHGKGTWILPGGAAAFEREGTTTALSFAPSPAHARSLARETAHP